MASPALADSIAGLFNSRKLSDVILRCDDRQWYAHKTVICTQSDFFETACTGGFTEADTGYIDLEDDDPVAVDAMLMYLYTGDYNDSLATTSQHPPIFNVRVFQVAKKFFVTPLSDLAAYKFSDAINKNWQADGFAEAVEEWRDHVDDPDKNLGGRIVEGALHHAAELFDVNDNSARFRKLVETTPWLSAEIAQTLALRKEARDPMALYRCPNPACKEIFKGSVTTGKRLKFRCQKCRRKSNMNWLGWQRYTVNLSVVTSYVDDDNADTGDE